MKRKNILMIIIMMFVFLLTSCKNNKCDIISTCFAGYDLSRAVAKDKMTTGMLLKPGQELHDYSPSVADIEKILNAKIFIYIGGESDSEWVENDILPEIDQNKTKVINMMEVVKNGGHIYDEEDPSSAEAEAEEEEEYDEHIWTSITNAKLILEAISRVICSLDNDNESYYLHNRDEYYDELVHLDIDIKDTLSLCEKNLIIFADRFPLLYFVKEYGLEYDAAFKGCESSKEANPKTIESLTKKVIDNQIKVIFVIELSESNIADTIINNCKKSGLVVKKMTFYTMHNVSKDDYSKGTTYIDFMYKNLESLKEALN